MKLTHKQIKAKFKAKLVFTILGLISITIVIGLAIGRAQIGFIWSGQAIPSCNSYTNQKYKQLHYQASFIGETLALFFIVTAIIIQIKVLRYEPQQNAGQKSQNNKQTKHNIDDKIENKNNSSISKSKQRKQIQNSKLKTNNNIQDQQTLKKYYSLKMKQSWVILSLCQLSLLRPTIFYVTLIYEIIYKCQNSNNLFWLLNGIFSSLALILTIIIMIIDYKFLSKLEDNSKILFQKQKEVKEEALDNKSEQISNQIEDVSHIKDVEKPLIINRIQNSLKSLDTEIKLQKREPLIQNKKAIIEKQKSNSNILLMDSQSQPSFRPKKKRKKQVILQTEKQPEKNVQIVQPKQNKPVQSIKQQKLDTGGNHNHTHIYLGYPYGNQPAINNSLPNAVETPQAHLPPHFATNYQNVTSHNLADNFSFNKKISKNKQPLRNQKKKRKDQIQQDQMSSSSSDEQQKLRKNHRQIKRQKEIKKKQRQYEQLKRKIEQIKRQQQKQNHNTLQKQISRYETKLAKNIIQVPIRPIQRPSNKPLKLQRQFQLQHKPVVTLQEEPLVQKAPIIQIGNSRQEKVKQEVTNGQMKKGKFINRSLCVEPNEPNIKQQPKIYPFSQELKAQNFQIDFQHQKFKTQNLDISQGSEKSSKLRFSKNKKHTLSQYIADLNNLQHQLQQYSSRLSDAERNYISDNNYTSILNQVDEGKVPIERQQLQKISLSSIKKSVALKDCYGQKQINEEHPLLKIYRKYGESDKKYK